MTNFKIHHLYRKGYTSFQRYRQLGNYIDAVRAKHADADDHDTELC